MFNIFVLHFDETFLKVSVYKIAIQIMDSSPKPKVWISLYKENSFHISAHSFHNILFALKILKKEIKDYNYLVI